MKTKSNLIHLSLLYAVKLPAVSLLLLAQTVLGQQWISTELPPGLIGWWQTDGNFLDSAGTNHLQADGNVTFPPGRFGQAFRFDGVSASAYQAGAAPALNDWSQFSLEAWINLDDTNDIPNAAWGRAIFSRVGNPGDHNNFNNGYQFGIYNNSTRVFFQFNASGQGWPGNQTTVALPAPLLTGVWYHLGATYDHNAMKIFFNGLRLITNSIGPVTVTHASSLFRISKDDNLNVPFPERIDDARIYNRALSAAEIAYLYAGPNLPVTQGMKFHLDASNVNGDGSNPADGALVNDWRDLSGLGLDATPLFGVAPVYHVNALNGRAGVDFSLSGSDALATAFTSQFNFTNCTIFMVANGAGMTCHVSVSAPCVTQEFVLGDKSTFHESSPFHWVNLSHQASPAGYFLQAGVFGAKASQLVNFI